MYYTHIATKRVPTHPPGNIGRAHLDLKPCISHTPYLRVQVSMEYAFGVEVNHPIHNVSDDLHPHSPGQLYCLVHQELLQRAAIDVLKATSIP